MAIPLKGATSTFIRKLACCEVEFQGTERRKLKIQTDFICFQFLSVGRNGEKYIEIACKGGLEVWFEM